jgi:hypothetical protein
VLLAQGARAEVDVTWVTHAYLCRGTGCTSPLRVSDGISGRRVTETCRRRWGKRSAAEEADRERGEGGDRAVPFPISPAAGVATSTRRRRFVVCRFWRDQGCVVVRVMHLAAAACERQDLPERHEHVTAATGKHRVRRDQDNNITFEFLELHYRQTSSPAARSPVSNPKCEGKKKICNARSSRGGKKQCVSSPAMQTRERYGQSVHMKTY